MRKIIDLSGQKFNRLSVIKRAENKGNCTMYECVCDCGKTLIVSYSNLKNGQKSCGCYTKELFKSEYWSKLNSSHGYYNHELYQTWNSMIRRCYNKNNSDYKNYGARGIKVCDRWNQKSPENFIKDIEKSIGKRPKNHTLDRIDNDGNYEINNVKWSSKSEQSSNQRKPLGVTMERYITRRKNGLYVVAFTRDKSTIFSRQIKDFERAIFIRDYYLNLYENNKDKWKSVCKERNYIKE